MTSKEKQQIITRIDQLNTALNFLKSKLYATEGFTDDDINVSVRQSMKNIYAIKERKLTKNHF